MKINNIVKSLLLVWCLGLVLGPWAALAAEEAADDDLSGLLEQETSDTPGLTMAKEEKLWGIQYEGELRANLWYKYDDDPEWKTTNRLDLLAEKEANNLKVLGRVKFDYQNLEADPDFRADVREMYARYRVKSSWFEYLDMIAGKKIVYWGKGDEVRPLDIVCPEDMTSNIYYLKNERKTGVLGLFADLALNQHVTLEVFWSPYFQKSWTPDLGDYFEPYALRKLHDAGVAEGSAMVPDNFSDMASVGGRLKLSVARFDIGLYAYQGYSNLPTYEITSLMRHPVYGIPIPTEVSPEYYRLTMYGADFERAVGDFVLRGEVAYMANGDHEMVDWQHDYTLLVQYPNGIADSRSLQYVVGLDKNNLFIRNLFMNIQYVGQYITDYDDVFADDQVTHGATLYFQYSIMDSLFVFYYRGVADFTHHTYRNRFDGAYKINNWSEVSLGVIIYNGDADTLFGQYDNQDFVYTQLKVIF